MGLHDMHRGLDALRRALAEVLASGLDGPGPLPVTAYDGPLSRPTRTSEVPWLLAQTSQSAAATATAAQHDDSALATSSVQDAAEGSRLIALVELARNGDSEAFGQLYD